jgi:hypothetical protein
MTNVPFASIDDFRVIESVTTSPPRSPRARTRRTSRVAAA